MIPFGGWAQKPPKNIAKAYFLRYRIPDPKSVENHYKTMLFGGCAQKPLKTSAKAYVFENDQK